MDTINLDLGKIRPKPLKITTADKKEFFLKPLELDEYFEFQELSDAVDVARMNQEKDAYRDNRKKLYDFLNTLSEKDILKHLEKITPKELYGLCVLINMHSQGVQEDYSNICEIVKEAATPKKKLPPSTGP